MKLRLTGLWLLAMLFTTTVSAQNFNVDKKGPNTFQCYFTDVDTNEINDTTYQLIYVFSDGFYHVTRSFYDTITHQFGPTHVNGDVKGEITVYLKGVYGSQDLPTKSYTDTINNVDAELYPRRLRSNERVLIEQVREAVPGYLTYFTVVYDPITTRRSLPQEGYVEILGLDTTTWQHRSVDNPAHHFPVITVTEQAPEHRWTYEHEFERIMVSAEFFFYVALYADPTLALAEVDTFPINVVHHYGNSKTDTFPTVLRLSNSFDPNYLTAYPADVMDCNFSNDTVLYTGFVQNEGTSHTNNIRLVMQLDQRVDVSTYDSTSFLFVADTAFNKPSYFEPRTVIDSARNTITFFMDTLVLQGMQEVSEAEEYLTKAYVQFKVKTRANVMLDTALRSRMHVFFDYNEAVTTDWAITSCPNAVVDFVSDTAISFTPEEKLVKPVDLYDCDNRNFLCGQVFWWTCIGVVLLLLLLLFSILKRKRRKEASS